MTRTAALLASLTLAGCGGGATGPNEVGGTYELLTANGQSLPLLQFVLLSSGDGCALDLRGSHVSFTPASGRFNGNIRYYRDCAGSGNDGTASAELSGTYSANGRSLTFTSLGTGLANVRGGRIDGDGIVLDVHWNPPADLTLVYAPVE